MDKETFFNDLMKEKDRLTEGEGEGEGVREGVREGENGGGDTERKGE